MAEDPVLGGDGDTPGSSFRWRTVLAWIAVWTLIVGGVACYYAWKWLAFDEPDVDLFCSDGTAQCSSGEANNRRMAISFALLWFAPFVLTGIIVLWALRLRAQQRRDAIPDA